MFRVSREFPIILLKLLILITIVVNVYGLFSPILASNDASFYSVIAKHIVTSNDWVSLTFANQDWLDKPHFPFWLTAISYKIFGINTFAYILPGFLFHLLGGYYTYRLAKYLYNEQIGLLSALIYFSSLRLMLSAIDVRAEAFLLGLIIPACYYWLCYDRSDKIRFTYLVLGAIFTAMALMTKGLFVLLTITSGLVVLWGYERRLYNFFKPKWLLALLLSFIFALPEFVSLYLQFDLHPEKLVFGKHNVSGVKFFFWESQFGRFFDIGPITSGKGQDFGHYFFFLHTFMWAFLPWSLIFIAAVFSSIKILLNKSKTDILEACHPVQDMGSNLYYLFGSFLPTFILFSLTKFQLDHYTNIIIPFSSIMCAAWLYSYLPNLPTVLILRSNTRVQKSINACSWVLKCLKDANTLFYLQIALAIVLLVLVGGISFLLFSGVVLIIIEIICVIILLLFLIFRKNYYINKAIICSVLAINLVFIFAMLVNNKLYIKYDAGYQVAKYLEGKANLESTAKIKLLDGVGLSSLEFNLGHALYLKIDNFTELNKQQKSGGLYYVLIRKDDESKFLEIVSSLPVKLLDSFQFIPQNKFPSVFFNKEKTNHATQVLSLYQIN